MSIEETQTLLNPGRGGESGEDDVKGVPLDRRSASAPVPQCRRRIAGMSILLVLTLERMAFYSITGNLYLYLNHKPMGWMPYNAMNASYVFTGVAYLMAIIGGWFADAVLGRFWTILLALVVYSGGYSMLVFMASYGQDVPAICFLSSRTIPFANVSNASGPAAATTTPGFGFYSLFAVEGDANIPLGALTGADSEEGNDELHAVVPGQEICGWLIYLVLVVIGLAVGSIRSNVAPFGADQYKYSAGDAMRRFFNWFYWCVNIGAFLSLGVIAYIQQTFTDGFFIGYLIPVVALGVAIVIFVLGRPWYVVQKPAGSLLINILKILREAYQSKRRYQMRIQRQKSHRIDLPSPDDVSAVATTGDMPSWLDMAKVRYGGSFHETVVEDVKTLGKVIVVFVALIPYWVVYFQMQTSYPAQGIHMKLNPYTHHTDTGNSFTIPAAWLTLFDVIFLLILIPVMDRLVYPYLDRHHIHLNLLFKISLGMAFSLISVVVAGCLEFYRLNLIQTDNSTVIIQVVGNTSYYAADLWIFWQVPQYALIGISEVFASVASLEFAYSQSPKSMRGIIMGLYCFSTGIGSFVGTGLLEAVRPFWFTSRDSGSLNQSHLDYYFFLLGGIQLVTVVVFNLVAKKCHIVGNDSLLYVPTCEFPSTQMAAEQLTADKPSPRRPHGRMIVSKAKRQTQ